MLEHDLPPAPTVTGACGVPDEMKWDIIKIGTLDNLYTVKLSALRYQ